MAKTRSSGAVKTSRKVSKMSRRGPKKATTAQKKKEESVKPKEEHDAMEDAGNRMEKDSAEGTPDQEALSQFEHFNDEEKKSAIDNMSLSERGNLFNTKHQALVLQTLMHLKHSVVEGLCFGRNTPDGVILRYVRDAVVHLTDFHGSSVRNLGFNGFVEFFKLNDFTYTRYLIVSIPQEVELLTFGYLKKYGNKMGDRVQRVRATNLHWECTETNATWIGSVVKFAEPGFLKSFKLLGQCTSRHLSEIIESDQWKECKEISFDGRDFDLERSVKFDYERLKHATRLEAGAHSLSADDAWKMIQNFRERPLGSSFVIDTNPRGLNLFEILSKFDVEPSNDPLDEKNDNATRTQRFSVMLPSLVLVVRILKSSTVMPQEDRIQGVVCRRTNVKEDFKPYIKVEAQQDNRAIFYEERSRKWGKECMNRQNVLRRAFNKGDISIYHY